MQKRARKKVASYTGLCLVRDEKHRAGCFLQQDPKKRYKFMSYPSADSRGQQLAQRRA